MPSSAAGRASCASSDATSSRLRASRFAPRTASASCRDRFPSHSRSCACGSRSTLTRQRGAVRSRSGPRSCAAGYPPSASASSVRAHARAHPAARAETAGCARGRFHDDRPRARRQRRRRPESQWTTRGGGDRSAVDRRGCAALPAPRRRRRRSRICADRPLLPRRHILVRRARGSARWAPISRARAPDDSSPRGDAGGAASAD